MLTFVSDDLITHFAWDAGAVTTGPVTVPLIMSLGIAVAKVNSSDGFGILALASVYPILTVLMTGVFIRIPFVDSYIQVLNQRSEEKNKKKEMGIRDYDSSYDSASELLHGEEELRFIRAEDIDKVASVVAKGNTPQKDHTFDYGDSEIHGREHSEIDFLNTSKELPLLRNRSNQTYGTI